MTNAGIFMVAHGAYYRIIHSNTMERKEEECHYSLVADPHFSRTARTSMKYYDANAVCDGVNVAEDDD